ncbi:unnamed protein product, partial [marine sediment metagenome]
MVRSGHLDDDELDPGYSAWGRCWAAWGWAWVVCSEATEGERGEARARLGWTARVPTAARGVVAGGGKMRGKARAGDQRAAVERIEVPHDGRGPTRPQIVKSHRHLQTEIPTRRRGFTAVYLREHVGIGALKAAARAS